MIIFYAYMGCRCFNHPTQSFLTLIECIMHDAWYIIMSGD